MIIGFLSKNKIQNNKSKNKVYLGDCNTWFNFCILRLRDWEVLENMMYIKTILFVGVVFIGILRHQLYGNVQSSQGVTENFQTLDHRKWTSNDQAPEKPSDDYFDENAIMSEEVSRLN